MNRVADGSVSINACQNITQNLTYMSKQTVHTRSYALLRLPEVLRGRK